MDSSHPWMMSVFELLHSLLEVHASLLILKTAVA